jgi:hypothetical protein
MKYKILHLIPTLGSGGAERQLVNLVSSTSRETVNHVVCTIGEPVFFAPDIRENGYKVIELKIFNKHPFFQTASKFRRIIREEKPDIIKYFSAISSFFFRESSNYNISATCGL